MTAVPDARTRPRSKSWWREWLEAVALALAVTTFLVSGVHVDGASMMPNLRSGELVLINKASGWLHRFGAGGYQRGNIIVFKPPTEATGEWQPAPGGLWNYRPFLIKRVVGLPGDRVRVQGGQVWVNGRLQDQAFITAYWRQLGCWDTQSAIANHAQSGDEYPYVRTQREFTVPEGRYFVMGDNRSPNGSEDSRHFGPVRLNDIAGRAVVSVWPLARRERAQADCTYKGPRPQDAVQFSGPLKFNPRLLIHP